MLFFYCFFRTPCWNIPAVGFRDRQKSIVMGTGRGDKARIVPRLLLSCIVVLIGPTFVLNVTDAESKTVRKPNLSSVALLVVVSNYSHFHHWSKRPRPLPAQEYYCSKHEARRSTCLVLHLNEIDFSEEMPSGPSWKMPKITGFQSV